MNILVANDDGIYAPGLIALARAMESIGNVFVVAPATEQSGVGHSITYLTPLTCKRVFDDEDRFRGWAVNGSPADSVKLGVLELIPKPVDLVVSGINSGLNAGINVLYSGTVAASIEGAFFGITSVAVSLEFDLHADYAAAADIACELIRKLLRRKAEHGAELFNINVPTAATRKFRDGQSITTSVVPLGVARYGDRFQKRQDPKGRDYYWSYNEAMESTPEASDMSALANGHVTVTPMQFDLTLYKRLESVAADLQ